MKKIGIIGSGFVGQATGKAYALKGYEVTFHDTDPKVLKKLEKEGYIVEEDIKKLEDHDFLFLCVPTPSTSAGIVLGYIWKVVDSLQSMKKPKFRLIIKSTVIPGTCRGINDYFGSRQIPVYFVPEFLEERNALKDVLMPSMIVVGSEDGMCSYEVKEIFEIFDVPILIDTYETCEMIKYAHNCWLATNVGYWNKIYEVCDKVEANKGQVLRGAKMSKYFGIHPWYAGRPYGGACLPKEMQALISFAEKEGVKMEFLRIIEKDNKRKK